MKIICVDDHPIILQGLENSVRKLSPEADIHAFQNADKALDFVKKNGCDVLICEIELGDDSGLTLAQKIKSFNPKVNIIFHTVCDEKEHAREVLMIKPSGYLLKPAKIEQIKAELKNLRYCVS